ncbi:hypothetical protein OROHE_001105 [Orobanche hederae]
MYCKILVLVCPTKEVYYFVTKKHGTPDCANYLGIRIDPKYVSYIARHRRREIMSRKRKRPL